MMEDAAMGISRRTAIGGIATGIATLAMTQGMAGPTATIDKLEDPTTKYPKPPFEKQSQPWPGLASKMNPRPAPGSRRDKL
jgi:hypothetical protein